MRWVLLYLFAILMTCPHQAPAQVSGNIAYSSSGGKARAEQTDRASHHLTKEELPPTGTSSFVEANILMNVKADEYVAVFGIMHEGQTLNDCGKKMEATLAAFLAELKTLGIGANDVFVDFVTQNKIYGYQVEGDFLQEKLVGMELKKNVAIHYKDHALLDKLTLTAAKVQVFDLIKVDYIVKDVGAVQDRLMEEATRIVKKKMARYENLLGIRLQTPAQVYAEKTAVHYPTQMYDSYTAFESEEVRADPERKKYVVRHARKGTTLFYNGMAADGFDAVVNPVLTEPVVQFTLYLKVKYDVEQPKPRPGP
jgi:uncharacterized protein YggE